MQEKNNNMIDQTYENEKSYDYVVVGMRGWGEVRGAGGGGGGGVREGYGTVGWNDSAEDR